MADLMKPSLWSSAPFRAYLLMMLFVTLGDATMSYIAPVIMEGKLGSSTLMGAILATSSMVGSLTDFTFSRLGSRKDSNFFNKILVSLVLLFPLLFLVSQSLISFLFAMAIWGVYFEAIVFSNYHFIHEYVHKDHHAHAWGILTLTKSVAWTLGPLLASTLDGSKGGWPLLISIGSFVLAIIIYIYRRLRYRKHKIAETEKSALIQRSFKEEVAIWKEYSKVLWPLMVLVFLCIIMDATFFTIGPLFAESLKPLHPFGGFLVTLYSVPNLIMGLFVGKLARPFGKKRAAYAAGVAAGIGFIAMSRIQSIPLMLLATFIGSMGIAVMYPELEATFEDYVDRAKGFGNDIVGLSAVMASLAYVVGPLLTGFLADRLDYRPVFGIVGALVLVFSVLAFAIVKRKVRLPNHLVAEAAEVVKQEVV